MSEPTKMQLRSGKLLLDEAPIAISPTLARIFGLPEAVFLQQIHYWLHLKNNDPKSYRNHFIAGRYWVHWTMAELRNHVPLGKSDDPYKRVTRKLRELGILLVERHKQSSWVQTNHYSIDYNAFDAEVSRRCDSPKSGDATDRVDEGPLVDECAADGTMGGNATDHRTKTSPKRSSETTTTDEALIPGGRGATVAWSLVPDGIRGQILALIPPHLDPQRCIDMLAARLERDGVLPKNFQIGSPIKWFEKALGNPDFSAADNFAAERQRAADHRVEADLSSTRAAASVATQESAQKERECAALAALAQLDEQRRTALAAAAVEACGYPHFAPHIRDAVSRGHLPEQRFAKLAVFKALKMISSKGAAP